MEASSERHGQATCPGDGAFPGGIPSGKHMHGTSHKHHHKHKEKRHEHSHHRTARQGDDFELHGGGGDEYNEQGRRGGVVAPKIPGGKPTAFLIKEERRTSTSDEMRASDREPAQKQHGSHEGHKHHKKKKKKHKHSRLSVGQSEPDISPTAVHLSETEVDEGQRLAPTPLSTGSKSFARKHAQEHLAGQQETPVSTRETGSIYPVSKTSQKPTQEASGVHRSSSGLEVTQRSSPEWDSSSSHLPLRRLSQESRTTIKLQSPDSDTQPPPPKRVKIEDSKASPLLLDISQTRGRDSEAELQHQTPPPPLSTHFQPSTRQLSSHGSADAAYVGSASIATPPSAATASKPRAEARRSSVEDKAFSTMAPPSPLPNQAEMRTPQGTMSKVYVHVCIHVHVYW